MLTSIFSPLLSKIALPVLLSISNSGISNTLPVLGPVEPSRPTAPQRLMRPWSTV